MKLTTGILAIAITMTGAAWAQNTDAIDNARSTAKALQIQQDHAINQALEGSGAAAAPKPAPGAPAPAVKPATIPGQASAPAPAPKAVSAAPVAAAKTSSHNNQMQHVNVVPGTENIQIEISSSQPVTPKLTKLSSPERVLIELPETVVASAQNKIPVGSGGVKGVRIGMDGKTPPTTSVVVDLDKPLAYELAPSPAGKVILILHSQGTAPVVAKNPAPAPAVAKATPAPVPVAAKAAPVPVAAKTTPAPVPAKTVPVPVPAPKVADAKAPASKPAAPAQKVDPKQQSKTVVAAKPAPAAQVAAEPAPAKAEAPKPKPEEKKWAMSGKRDPFFSPVIQQSGSGCSTGKKCLEIGAINLRGVIKSDSGFIAVVTNNLNKAYFLRENDPVFNGYVVKITGDSVTFSETIQDKLGKSFTREVVKRIFTPAV